MRKASLLLVCVLAAVFAFTACENPTGGTTDNPGDNPGGGTGVTVDRSIQAVDADGELIGYVLNMGPFGVQLITEGGYLFYVDLDGSFNTSHGSIDGTDYQDGLFFSENNLQGDAIYVDDYFNDHSTVYGKQVFYMDITDKFYTLSLEEGATYPTLITEDTTVVSYLNDHYDSEDTIENGTFSITDPYFEVEEITDPDLLSLLDITGPISINIVTD